MPFTIKKSVVPALRKDMWSPLCTITLPEGSGSTSGLSVFQKLREFRKLHELSWDPTAPEFNREKEDGTSIPVTRKVRSHVLQNQKANTVADMAAVLRRIRDGDDSIGLKGIGRGAQVEISWRELQDAELAAEWGGAVVHNVMDRGVINNRTSTIWREAVPAEKISKAERLATRALQHSEWAKKKNANIEAARLANVQAAIRRSEAIKKHKAYMATLVGVKQAYAPAKPGKSLRAQAIRAEREQAQYANRQKILAKRAAVAKAKRIEANAAPSEQAKKFDSGASLGDKAHRTAEKKGKVAGGMFRATAPLAQAFRTTAEHATTGAEAATATAPAEWKNDNTQPGQTHRLTDEERARASKAYWDAWKESSRGQAAQAAWDAKTPEEQEAIRQQKRERKAAQREQRTKWSRERQY